MMRTGLKRANGFGLSAILAAAVLLPSSVAGQEEYRVGGGEVAVYNLAGRVEIIPGSGNEVVVEVMRGGGDAEELEIDLTEVDGWQSLIVRYPSDRVVYSALEGRWSTQIRVREDGTFFGDGRSSGSREVEVASSGRGLEAWADLRIALPRGQELAVFLAAGNTGLQEVEGTFLIDTGSGAVSARSASGELTIDTGSGEVTVDGFQGQLNVDTGSGEVELSDIRGGEVMVDTGSGDVRGSVVRASMLEVDPGSGEIELRGVSASEVVLDTGSGDVELELLEDVDRMNIDTGSGSVILWVPSSLGAQVEMDTSSGGIDVDVPLEIREVKRDYVRGVIGDGNGNIRVDTGSGEIRIAARG